MMKLVYSLTCFGVTYILSSLSVVVGEGQWVEILVHPCGLHTEIENRPKLARTTRITLSDPQDKLSVSPSHA
jgi:hypothetical protein